MLCLFLLPLHCGNHWPFYCLHSFAFSRVSYSWNLIVQILLLNECFSSLYYVLCTVLNALQVVIKLILIIAHCYYGAHCSGEKTKLRHKEVNFVKTKTKNVVVPAFQLRKFGLRMWYTTWPFLHAYSAFLAFLIRLHLKLKVDQYWYWIVLICIYPGSIEFLCDLKHAALCLRGSSSI